MLAPLPNRFLKFQGHRLKLNMCLTMLMCCNSLMLPFVNEVKLHHCCDDQKLA
jgi:hypothetical protein